jgi:hypothetical protein
MNPRHRNPYDLTDRYGPRRLRGRSALDDDYRSPLEAIRSPAFWASAAIVIVLAYLFVRAL